MEQNQVGAHPASQDRAATPSEPSPEEVSGKAGIPCAEHTPLPWGISHGYACFDSWERQDYVCGPDPKCIGIKLATPWIEGAWDNDPEAAANAAFIVRACNSHYDLVEVLERIAAGVDGASAAKIARKALAKARGEQVSA